MFDCEGMRGRWKPRCVFTGWIRPSAPSPSRQGREAAVALASDARVFSVAEVDGKQLKGAQRGPALALDAGGVRPAPGGA